MATAAVVGSGPNGLASAVCLALAGIDVTVYERADRIGGGTRTSELTLRGVLHDECAAFHPSGVVSPFFTALGLEQFGLRWRWPEIDLAHPLDDGRAGVLSREMARTLDTLGADGPAWRRLFEPLAAWAPELAVDALGPVVHLPRHPIVLGRFGIHALLPATRLIARWSDEPARALFTGSAAHAFGRLDRPLGAAVGMLLTTLGHAVGWPVAQGGSRAVSDALHAKLASLGGTVRVSVPIEHLDDLDADLVLLDVAPDAAVRIVGSAMPDRIRKQLLRYRYGPAAFKVDFAVREPIPWTSDSCRRAGTVHVGGSAAEIAAAEAATARGEMPTRPFVLVGQQYLADRSRSAGGVHPIWAYAHVPHGYSGDATGAVIARIEQFAPGFRDCIVATHTRGPAQLAADNPNYVGGDIGIGANTARQLVARPRSARNPFTLGVPGVYLCSSATPPGGGVHGMCGFHAARAALADLG